MIEIVPAIDIIDGKCVRLSKGDYDQKKVYDASPQEMAKAYSDCGVRRIHLVDLDGAKCSKPMNLKVLEAVASSVDCTVEWGGGISGEDALASVFDAGADHAVIGSVAALHPELFEQWLDRFGAEKMVLGADVKNGLIAVKGWLEIAQLSIDDLVKRFMKNGLSQVICTEISRDGMLQGPADELYVRLQEAFPEVAFTVSGGISSMTDIQRLDSLGLKKVIVGKAIYEDRITLKDIQRWSLNV